MSVVPYITISHIPFIYDYISHHDLERQKFKDKLSRDWERGVREKKSLTVPSSATHAKVFDNDKRLLVAVDSRVYVFNLEQGGVLEITFCKHKSRVSCLGLEGDLAGSGDLNGMLIVWEWRTGKVIAEKQMFGRIEVLKVRNGYLATGHISKSYDTGCLSIRKIQYNNKENNKEDLQLNSPSENKKPKVNDVPEVNGEKGDNKENLVESKKISLELPVVFSWFGDIYPVADLDFNEKYMCILQWNCTFMGINTGSVSVYNFCSKDRQVANLSSRSGRATFSRCVFLPGRGNSDFMVTAADDGMLRLWRLPAQPSDTLECLRFMSTKLPIVNLDIDPLGHRMIARDVEGQTDIWDIDLLKRELLTLEDGSKFDEEKAIVLKESSRSFLTHTALAISSRWFIMGDLDTSVLCYDVWT